MDVDAYSIDEFCKRNGIGRSKTYEEIRAGRLSAVKVGRRTLIPTSAAVNWLESLPSARQSDDSSSEIDPNDEQEQTPNELEKEKLTTATGETQQKLGDNERPNAELADRGASDD